MAVQQAAKLLKQHKNPLFFLLYHFAQKMQMQTAILLLFYILGSVF